MTISRRSALARFGAFSVISLASISDAAAVTTYRYDSLGRLRVVTFDNGTVVHYIYDGAGNRSQVVRSPSGTFSATIPITGTAPVNLRTLANTAGYDGAQDATIAFTLANGVTITGTAGTGAPAPAGTAIDTGDWPDPAFSTLSLSLSVSGKVYGGGGAGGFGASISNAHVGGIGGDAIYCRIPISVTVNSGGEVKAGGGGGGGGASWYNTVTELYAAGGGGGGGFPNGPLGPGANGTTNNGAAGTTAGGGAGGTRSSFGSNFGGNGGAGGNAGTNGVDGNVTTGPGGANWVQKLAREGGIAGYAIRKNGNTVPVTNNGTIVGAQG